MGNNQYFNSPITDIIKSRHSVRTYKNEKLGEELRKKIIMFAKDIQGPFNSKVRLKLIDELENPDNGNGKIGTYGVIKGARAFIAGVVLKEDNSLEQLGYCLEKLVLYAASLGLGTCWLGGTFRRSGFSKAAGLKENEILPIVTPIGYEADKRSIVEGLMRRAAGSDNRKAWNELFFEGDFENPLVQRTSGAYETALEMVRLAPSASNKQPWRILKQGNNFHFYLKSSKGYDKALSFNIQRIDMGIAMCHFELSLRESGINGKWVYEPLEESRAQARDMEYTISWITE